METAGRVAPISLTVKCDRCDNEATTHEVMIKGGKRQERHLCEACAKAEGMLTAQSNVPITQLLNQFITSTLQGGQAGATPPPGPGAVPAGTCGCCGTTLAQFRQTGLLGCPECYAAFEGQLSPLLQRAHEGGTHHVGKRPMRLREPGSVRPVPAIAPVAPAPAAAAPAVSAQGEAALVLLRAKLAEAVRAERYEEAADLRDQIQRLESCATPPAEPATPARRAPRSARSPKGEGGKGPA